MTGYISRTYCMTFQLQLSRRDQQLIYDCTLHDIVIINHPCCMYRYRYLHVEHLLVQVARQWSTAEIFTIYSTQHHVQYMITQIACARVKYHVYMQDLIYAR